MGIKVGDKVVVTNVDWGYHGFNPGDIVKVTRIYRITSGGDRVIRASNGRFSQMLRPIHYRKMKYEQLELF